jgi:cytidylate kinase
VICLSHADGAGGREIGELLAQRLGFRYVDEGILVAAADAGQLYPEAVAVAESRDAGLKRFYGISRELPTHYDLVVNTERVGADRAVDAIVAAAG